MADPHYRDPDDLPIDPEAVDEGAEQHPLSPVRTLVGGATDPDSYRPARLADEEGGVPVDDEPERPY